MAPLARHLTLLITAVDWTNLLPAFGFANA